MVSKSSFPTRLETSSNSMSSSVDFTPLLEPIGSNSTSPFPLVTINTSSQLPYKLTFSNYPSWQATFSPSSLDMIWWNIWTTLLGVLLNLLQILLPLFWHTMRTSTNRTSYCWMLNFTSLSNLAFNWTWH